jgi:hypothetical protein
MHQSNNERHTFQPYDHLLVVQPAMATVAVSHRVVVKVKEAKEAKGRATRMAKVKVARAKVRMDTILERQRVHWPINPIRQVLTTVVEAFIDTKRVL